MNKLNELIHTLCPDGVEYRSLGELGKFYGGLSGKSKDDFTDGNAKFITYKNVYSNPALQIDIEDRVKIADGEKQRTLKYGDVIFTGSSETPDECGISSVVTEKTEEKLYLNSFCFFFRFDDLKIILPDFAKHLFRSSNLRYQIGKTASGVTRFNVSKKLMENVIIPLPPLEVQSEIVRILDNFMELTAKITAEITAEITVRNKQYEYYREKILSQMNNAEQCALQDIVADSCSISYGIVQTGDDVENGIPVVRPVDLADKIVSLKSLKRVAPSIAESYKRTILKGGDLLLCVRGTTGVISIASDELKGCNVSRGIVPLTFKSTVCPQYIYYQFLSQGIQKEIESKTRGAALKQINMEDLRQIRFPVPTLEVQQQIVSILDRFYFLCNDITSGLSAEVEARQKQYEYYRDRLLTFKEVSKC